MTAHPRHHCENPAINVIVAGWNPAVERGDWDAEMMVLSLCSGPWVVIRSFHCLGERFPYRRLFLYSPGGPSRL